MTESWDTDKAKASVELSKWYRVHCCYHSLLHVKLKDPPYPGTKPEPGIFLIP